jgi:hypothetical protein
MIRRRRRREEDVPSLLTTLFESTKRHVDGSKEDILPEVAIIYLNSNPDAFFSHGDETVTIKAGKLVAFDGHVEHNTVIPSGTVQFAGPFATEQASRNVRAHLAKTHTKGLITPQAPAAHLPGVCANSSVAFSPGENFYNHGDSL